MSFLRLGPISITALVVLIVVSFACGGGSEGAPSENSLSSNRQSGPAGGKQAPPFSVSTGGESTFSLDEHGGEVVLLYFSFSG